MKILRIALLITLLLSAGCAGYSADVLERQISLVPIYGSDLEGVDLHEGFNQVSITFTGVSSTGKFVKLELPDQLRLSSASWENDNGYLSLAAPVQDGIEIGLVALNGADGSPVAVNLELGAPGKEASIPPVGDPNVLTSLKVTSVGSNEVRLEWIQTNAGDYDFNSEVNIADLVPLAINYKNTYDRSAPGAKGLTEYWIDGDENGEINIADISPIGQNYGAFIAGYNIRKDDQLIAGPVPDGPTVPATDATPQQNLPPTYTFFTDGLVTDNWVVAPVDADGVEGADSSGNVGPVELRANIDITGQMLLDILDGLNPGAFGPGKSISRVIDPIEDIDIIKVGDVAMPTYNTIEARSLPMSQSLYLQVQYIPAVDLITGNPKGTAGLRNTSAIEDNYITTSIPLSIPAGMDPVQVSAQIDLSTANPSGGYFTDLHTEITFPGDNPFTPVVETSYVITRDIRLDNKNMLVASDTDQNGSFDDEAWVGDDDSDCASGSRREQELDNDEYEDGGFVEIEIKGTVHSFDEETGLITLTGAVDEEGGTVLPEPLVLHFSELTQFEERIKTDDDDYEQDIDPSTLQPGDTVEVDLYRLDDTQGSLPDKYWIEKIQRRIEF